MPAKGKGRRLCLCCHRKLGTGAPLGMCGECKDIRKSITAALAEPRKLRDRERVVDIIAWRMRRVRRH